MKVQAKEKEKEKEKEKGLLKLWKRILSLARAANEWWKVTLLLTL